MKKVLSMLGLGLAAACVEAPAGAGTGSQTFAAYCAACHGAEGRGGGRIANELPVPPPDLTRLAADNGGIFPDARVIAKIEGYPGAYPAQVMRGFGNLLDGPVTTWTDQTGAQRAAPRAVRQLRDYLVGLQAD